MMGKSTYLSVLQITEDYLGPAAPRFLQRLCVNHLDKTDQKLTHKDIPDLIVWIKLATMVITEDERLAKEYVSRLEKLAH